jgi:hypothetical protein
MRHRGPAGDRIAGVAPVSASQLAAGFSPASTLPTIADFSPKVRYTFEATNVTKDGSDLVSAVADQGSLGNDLGQATGSLQPLWTASSANFNGYPTLTFDGVNDWMIQNSVMTGGQYEWWMVCVGRFTSPTGIDYGAMWQYSAASDIRYNWPLVMTSPYVNFTVYNGSAYQAAIPFDTNAHLFTVTCFKGGNEFTTTDNTLFTGGIGMDGAYFGGSYGYPYSKVSLGAMNTGVWHSPVEIAELIMFQETLTQMDEYGILVELSEKYNIPLLSTADA